MMDGTFVRELADLISLPDREELNGRDRLLLPKGWTDATPKAPAPEPMKVHTLTGLVDYVKANRDVLPLTECMVHVLAHSTVEILAKLEDEQAEFRRKCFLLATTGLVGGEPFRFGQYQDAESFFIGLQSCFVATPQREEILMLLASIKENAVRDTVDTGVSQSVTTAGGVVLVGQTKVPNPVTLQPFRTFREIDQPASLFILRLKKDPNGEKPLCALFEADGSAWKLAAIQGIRNYLAAKIGTEIAIIA